MARADVVVSEAFRTPSAAHVPMEPHAAVAEWEDGRLTLWTGTQTPFNMRADLAGLFALQPEDVRIVVPMMGGSFGAKTFVRTEAVVAALARKAGRPVKVVLDRTEEFLTLNRHPATMRVRLGATRDGTLVAKELDCWVDTGAYADCGPGVATKLGYAGVGPYRIPHVRVDSLAVYTNLPPNGAYRGYGAMQSIFASERAMDILAGRLGMSPLELRRRNLLRDGDRFATGEVMHDVHFEECLQAAADAVGYEEDPRGKGLCVLLKGMQTPSRAQIAIERTPVGYVVRSASTEMGQGCSRSIQLMAAQLLELRAGAGRGPRARHGHRRRSTRGRRRAASTHMMGRALEVAVADLRAGDGERGFGEVVEEGGLDPDTGRASPPRTGTRARRPRTVSVDEETGKLTVEQLHGVAYAGRGGQPRGRRAAERRLDAHGPGHRAVRGDRLRRRPGRQREPLRLQRARRRATSPRASRTRSSSATARRCTASGRRSCRRCPRRSATRSPRSASTSASCPSPRSASSTRWTRDERDA